MAAKRETIVLCLIRCGETDWDVQQRLVGGADLPLTAAGRAAAEEVSRLLTVDRLATIYHPSDEAATETASLFATAMNAKARPLEGLRDPNLGLLQGLAVQEFAERYPKRYKQWQEDILTLSPPEGEDIIEARARLFGALSRALKRSRGDEIGVVLHTIGIGLVRCWLADVPCSQIWSLIDGRPVIERYVFGLDMVPWLEAATEVEYSRS